MSSSNPARPRPSAFAHAPRRDKPVAVTGGTTGTSTVAATGRRGRQASRCTVPRPAVAATAVAIATLAAAVRGAEPPLRAGAAAVDITPREFPLNLPGGFSANPAETVHDPLHARALAFADGAVTVAVVVVDNLGVGRETGDEARALAQRRCGLAPTNVMIAATHTHSAPPSGGTGGAAGAYRTNLVEGIAGAIERACAALRPAQVGFAVGALPDEVFNRRWFLKPGKMPPNPFGGLDQVKMNPGTGADVLDRPAGPTDPDITVIDVRAAEGKKPLALLASYSLHYVGGVPRGQVSADYYGEVCRLLPSRVGADGGFVGIMANGTSGDINNIPFLVGRPRREPYEQIGHVAGRVADTVTAARKGIDSYHGKVRVGSVWRELTLQPRRPTAEQVAWAKRVAAIKDPAELAREPNHADSYARRVLALAKGGDAVTVALQVLRVGDLAVCSIPFETFAEIGLDLKRRSPFPRTVVLGIANGSHGYLPTPEQHKLGGYETWLGTSRVQEDASVLITDQLLAMLDELRKGDGE